MLFSFFRDLENYRAAFIASLKRKGKKISLFGHFWSVASFYTVNCNVKFGRKTITYARRFMRTGALAKCRIQTTKKAEICRTVCVCMSVFTSTGTIYEREIFCSRMRLVCCSVNSVLRTRDKLSSNFNLIQVHGHAFTENLCAHVYAQRFTLTKV